jgi:hypothetical protein
LPGKSAAHFLSEMASAMAVHRAGRMSSWLEQRNISHKESVRNATLRGTPHVAETRRLDDRFEAAGLGSVSR